MTTSFEIYGLSTAADGPMIAPGSTLEEEEATGANPAVENQDIKLLQIRLRDAVRQADAAVFDPDEQITDWEELIFVKRGDEMPPYPCCELGWEGYR